MTFSTSDWGTDNATLVDPGPGTSLTSAWGTDNATLINPSSAATSEWGKANASLVPRSSSDWGLANAALATVRHFEWRFLTALGSRNARLISLIDPPDPPDPPEVYRDYLLQPYNSTSPWNTPIGDAADERPADLTNMVNGSGEVSVDPIRLAMDPTAPVKPISNGTTLNHVTMAVLSPSARIGYPDVASPQVRIANSITWNSGWNGIFGGLNAADLTQAWTGQALNRPTSSDNPEIYRTGPNYPTDIRGLDNLLGLGRKGAHGGGQAGGIGGCLRAWEYDAALAGNAQAIQHRLAINVYSVTNLSQANQGFGTGLSGFGWRWPAYTQDSNYTTPGANNYYGRNDGVHDGVVMGSLLALPESYSLAGITDPIVAAMAWTLKHFGAHIVDVVGTNPRSAFSVEQTRETAFEGRSVATFHTPLKNVLEDLILIHDCTQATPGGAGAPRTPPPPPLAP